MTFLCPVFRVKKYLAYRAKSKGRHGTHSPFVYELLEEVMDERKTFYAFETIEARRQVLLESNQRIHVVDYGAGSKFNTQNTRRVASIAKHSLKAPRYARLLFRLCNHLRYQKVMELGTSLGITTAYLAASGAQVTSLEGCASCIRIAEKGLKDLGYLHACALIEGRFEDTLMHPAGSGSELLNQAYDLIFIDGHHQGEALLRYAELLIPHLSPNGCLAVDDIHWSEDMFAAWNTLKERKEFQLSIDLFEMGLLFKRPGMSREHHTLRY